MSKVVNPSPFVIAAAASLAGSDGVPAWILLLPAGSFEMRDDRGTFHTGDRASMEAIVARSLAAAGQTELMMDYDHQSVFGAIPNVGGQAPASGWIKQLEVRDDGIWAKVEWTDLAAARIKAGEYRYISPLFTAGDDRAVKRIVNAALVNMPALNLKAIAAAIDKFTEKETEMKNIALALGLTDTASETAILAAIGGIAASIALAAGLKADAKIADIATTVTGLVAERGQIAVAAGLKADATTDQLVSAATQTSGADSVPRASFDKLSGDFNALKTSVQNDAADQAVAAAITAGKVTPAQKEWATKRAQADLTDFNEFVKNAPVLIAAQLGDKEKIQGAERTPEAIAASATEYQAEQAKAGRTVSFAEAAVHVRDNPKK